MKWLEERIQSEQSTRGENSCVTDRIIKERGEKEMGGRKRGENAKQTGSEEMTEAARWSEGKKILPIVDLLSERESLPILWKNGKTEKFGMSILRYIYARAGVGGVSSLKIAGWRVGETPNQLSGSGYVFSKKNSICVEVD